MVPIDLSQVSSDNFHTLAIDLYHYQREHNPIYRQFCSLLGHKRVSEVNDIPFLPISFFKSDKVSCSASDHLFYFESSGTSGQINSKHYFENLDVYYQSVKLSYSIYFGAKDYIIVGLLPHYLERQNSSLVAMVRHWMDWKRQEELFYLHDFEALYAKLNELVSLNKDILLFGISFALLDFAEFCKDKVNISALSKHLKIVETGGMKGARPEIPKQELISYIKTTFPKSEVLSEYGMCELFSQAYSDEKLWFTCPPWMRVLVGDVNDPLAAMKEGRGIAKIIDLANMHSCAFVETQDYIELNNSNQFQILGRVDQADLRGCSLMYH